MGARKGADRMSEEREPLPVGTIVVSGPRGAKVTALVPQGSETVGRIGIVLENERVISVELSGARLEALIGELCMIHGAVRAGA